MKNLLKKLKILESNNLFKKDENSNWKNKIPARLHKGLEEINPEYFLLQENKIIALFFDFTKGEKEEVYHKIWNFGGSPVIFVIKNGLLDIYNGFNFDIKSKNFTEIQKSINLEKDEIELDFSLINMLSGNLWSNKDFEKKNTVDEQLLRNLKNTRKILIEDERLSEEITTNIIGRLLFSRYLVDRGVKIDNKFQKYFENKTEFSKLILEKEKLYKYFEYLKTTFNGDLFPVLTLKENNIDEKEKINEKHLEILFHLFNGDEVGTGKNVQQSLFNLYDFKIIPIELISEIYEQFMGEKQGETSAFYTPSFLVDYILEKTVKKHLKTNKNCKIFDPSCGSGIFLVESLRLIIEKNIDELNKLEIKEKIIRLKNIIKDNIFGVDKDKGAINVTIFSLCLTILDYIEPKDITKFIFPTLKDTKGGKNLYFSDFFDLDNKFNSEIKNRNIDFILGNPPWGSYSDENKDKNHINYVKKIINLYGNNFNKYRIISDFEIAQSFMLRIQDFSTRKTKNALVLPAKILYNLKADNFRNVLVNNFILTEILELSPVRNKIFTKKNKKKDEKDAVAPTFIAFFQDEENLQKVENNVVIHKSIKPNLFLDKLNLLVIEKNDIKNVQQKYFLKYDYLWKILLYGNILDFHLINRLKENYKNINDFIEHNNLVFGQGIQIGGGNKNDSSHLIGKSFLDTGSSKKALSKYLINDKILEKFNKNYLHRVRNKVLFEEGPKILLKKGFSKKDFGIVNCYTEKEYVFTDSITVIVGKNKDKILLKSISAILNENDLGKYYFLQQGSSAGTEREQGHNKKDRFLIPIIENKKIANLVDKIQKNYLEINELNLPKENNKNKGQLNIDNLVDKKLENNLEEYSKLEKEKDNLEEKLNKTVLESFDFSESEIDLLNYTKEVIIPLINNDESVFNELEGKDGEKYLKNYAELFLDYFSETWNGENGKYFQIDIYKDKHLVGINFKVVDEKQLDKNRKEKIKFIEDKNILDEFKNLVNLGEEKITDTFYENRDIRGFNKHSFYIIKYNQKKNWHKGTGQADLSEFIGAMMKSGIKKINNN